MIEFCGELSYECKNYIRKKVIIRLLFIVIPIVLFLISILVVTGILWYDFSFISFLLGVVIIVSAALIYSGIAKNIYFKIPNKLTIKDGIIEIECEAMYQHHGAPTAEKRYTSHIKHSSRNIWNINSNSFTKVVAQDGTPIDGNYLASRKISEVKKVVDMGDWYQIIFCFGYKSHYFACQKDLIVNGTIEDFESLFEGKIEPAKNY